MLFRRETANERFRTAPKISRDKVSDTASEWTHEREYCDAKIPIMPEEISVATPNISRHSPAGRAVPFAAVLRAFAAGPSVPFWSAVRADLFESGTAALAIAIKRSLAIQRPIPAPRVALPAYGCPNLVAAALWAGATPVYYDLSPTAFAPRLETVSRLLEDRSIIVVHVDAFGAMTLEPLIQQLEPNLASNRIVHDLAQSFAPYVPAWQPSVRYSVVSTGRAKPVSLTLGGAVLTGDSGAQEAEEESEGLMSPASPLALLCRSAVYGLSLKPLLFGVLSRIPQLGIGRTAFHPLPSVRRLSDSWEPTFSAAAMHVTEHLAEYQADTDAMLALAEESGAYVPEGAARAKNRVPLWRVPVLCPTSHGAAQLARAGSDLGLSRLYERTIPEIMGSTQENATNEWPNASSIAGRLVTLPTHGRLKSSQLRRLRALLRAYARA